MTGSFKQTLQSNEQVLFPVGLNPDDDVLLTPDDFTGISFSKIRTIAMALRAKRDYMLQEQTADEDDGDLYG